MAVTVPAYDVVNFNLQAQIANKNTQLTNATQALNGPLVNTLQVDYYNLQLQLVLSLLGAGALSPATIISTMTYITPNVNGPVNAATSSQGPNAGTSAGGLI
jgi:hypothetical protein